MPKLPLTVSFTAAVCICGPDGLFGGTWPAASPWTNWRNTNVFFAAPVNSTRTGPENEKSVNWKLPPPYLSTGLLKVQRTHSAPSTLNAITEPATPKSVKCCDIGGTTGTPPPPTPIVWDGSCARVDVWLPKNIDPSKSPTANDPNAKVILDITPPSSGKAGNCSIWECRYGEPPPLESPPQRKKQHPIIPPKSLVPHSFAFFANEWVSANKRDARIRPLTKRLDRTGLLPFFITNARATHHRLLTAHRRQWRSTCGRAELCPSIKTALGAAPAPLVGVL